MKHAYRLDSLKDKRFRQYMKCNSNNNNVLKACVVNTRVSDH